jgi:DNA-binding MarR family transcriptional regulator
MDNCRMSKSEAAKAKRANRRSEADGATERAPAQEIDLGPLPHLVGYMLRRAQLAVFQDFWRGYEPFDIRPAQYAVLIVIERNPGLRQSQISSALNIKRANLVALLDSLEGRGLAKREPVATDRRSYALHLTDAGAALMRQLAELNAVHEARLNGIFGEPGRQDLLRLLHGITDALGGAPAGVEES